MKLSKTPGMTINNSFLLQEKTKLFVYQENLDFIGDLIVSLATTGTDSIERNVELFGSFSLALELNNKIHADKLHHNTFHTKLTSIFQVGNLIMDSASGSYSSYFWVKFFTDCVTVHKYVV